MGEPKHTPGPFYHAAGLASARAEVARLTAALHAAETRQGESELKAAMLDMRVEGQKIAIANCAAKLHAALEPLSTGEEMLLVSGSVSKRTAVDSVIAARRARLLGAAGDQKEGGAE